MTSELKNKGAVSLALLLHALIFGSMIVAVDHTRSAPITPLVVQATLVESVPDTPPPVVRPDPEPEPVVEEPEPEPEPEPEVEDPEPEPDNSEQLRREAEERKRQQDALIEQQRLEEQRKREEREAAERKQREEAEKERRRIEAERKRQEDIERQRQENERRRRELEAEQRANEIAAEEARIAEDNSPEMSVYQTMIRQKIFRNWSVPASMHDDVLCVAEVQQARGGDVISVRIAQCNGDEAVRRSIEAAIYRAAPLPDPPTPNLFRAVLVLNMSKQSD